MNETKELRAAEGCAPMTGSRLARCSVCGRITNDFVSYGSLAHTETCPAEMPHICGSSCMADASQKIAAGEWQVPKLRLACAGYAWNVSKPRKGYDPQPSQAELVNALVHTANVTVEGPADNATPPNP